ncbi:hypothetical protein NHF50_15535 [Flavobacterium sp. NRK F10]|uniref:Uncharacterized protein n=1 Tax=Flavobacterium sediminis TaxID=2201181 RepID=A0A2U8QZ86_9FLAO|nr:MULTISPECIES: hypothetical protein [Flavobacterium]AWM15174.1 hypothetical protein DI487_15780 [Flavobacterium sediminis]MCO6176462.1 hypothetical protein [Flavobacterium sp. NRK F10]
MEASKYLKDIQDIKEIMNKSTLCLSLSGLSGVLAGIYALIGAWLAYRTIYTDSMPGDPYAGLVITETILYRLIAIAFSVLIASVATGIIFSMQKAKRENESIWNTASKRLLINFSIPLVAGGIFILFLIEKEILNLVAPLTLLFYGLACVNASKYTLRDVRYLGLTMIFLGLLSTWFLNYGLLFWALGFGVCHILYGSIMYFKYDRN